MKQTLLLLTLSALLSCNNNPGSGDTDKNTDSTSNESIEQPKQKIDTVKSLDTLYTLDQSGHWRVVDLKTGKVIDSTKQ